MSKSISQHERDQAWAKLNKAGLTERQMKIIRNDILNKAIVDAEQKISSRERDGRKWRIVPQWQLAHSHNPQEEIDIAVYWYHDHFNHFWK